MQFVNTSTTILFTFAPRQIQRENYQEFFKKEVGMQVEPMTNNKIK